jgi:hypothetical protein
VNSAKTAEPAGNRYGKSFGLGLTGAVAGCLGVGIVSGVMGVWPLFFAFPLSTAYLVLSAWLGAALAALLARLWRRELSALAIMTISAVLTFVLFAALPLYFLLFVPGRDGGLLFG